MPNRTSNVATAQPGSGITGAVDESLEATFKGGVGRAIGDTLEFGKNVLGGESPGEGSDLPGVKNTILDVFKGIWGGLKNTFGMSPETKGILFGREAYLNPRRIMRALAGTAGGVAIRTTRNTISMVLGTHTGDYVGNMMTNAAQTIAGIPAGSIEADIQKASGSGSGPAVPTPA